jgi:hypothetical protein
MDVNLLRRFERTGTTPSQTTEEVRKKRAVLPIGAMALLQMGLLGSLGRPADAFTACGCNN